jgi:hypothetical protein
MMIKMMDVFLSPQGSNSTSCFLCQLHFLIMNEGGTWDEDQEGR